MDATATGYKNQSATGQVKAGAGVLYGIIVNSQSSGTLKLWDSLTATGNVIMNTYTFGTGSMTIMFPHPVNFYIGLFATYGGTADLTFLYN